MGAPAADTTNTPDNATSANNPSTIPLVTPPKKARASISSTPTGTPHMWHKSAKRSDQLDDLLDTVEEEVAPAAKIKGENALEQWAKAVQADPECRSPKFCAIMAVVNHAMQRCRKCQLVPDYALVRREVMKRFDEATCIQYEKHVRGLIDAVRSTW